jgi:hypothetical protein
VEGFVALWRGERPNVADLSDDAACGDALVQGGRLELDGQIPVVKDRLSLVVGAAGFVEEGVGDGGGEALDGLEGDPFGMFGEADFALEEAAAFPAFARPSRVLRQAFVRPSPGLHRRWPTNKSDL